MGVSVSKKANRPNQTVSSCARKRGGKGDAGDQLDGISRDYQPRSRNVAQGESTGAAQVENENCFLALTKQKKTKNSDDGPLQFSHLQIRISYKRLLRMSRRNGCL